MLQGPKTRLQRLPSSERTARSKAVRSLISAAASVSNSARRLASISVWSSRPRCAWLPPWRRFLRLWECGECVR